jgi:hypothetical protein
MKKSAPARRGPAIPDPSAKLPSAWAWWVDHSIPQYVKDTYSPQASWRGKPFTQDDARFFFKGISELSELFTDERPRDLPAYFAHPKYRSAYLLYFLPLQAAKLATLYARHPEALQATLAHGRRQGALRVLDLGAGPGTASLALILALLDAVRGQAELLPPLEFHWYDTQEAIMRDGAGLAERITERFPGLKGRIDIKMHARPWWDAFTERGRQATGPGEFSLVLSAHVLNEFPWHDAARAERASQTLAQGLARRSGGGFLWVEPAFKSASQQLSRLRDSWFERGVLPTEPDTLWGPCLHALACPLAEGRDWCHFSVRADLPGHWFRGFSRGLGSERQWLKFSYLWVSGADAPAPVAAPELRRVVSDPLKLPSGAEGVLLCEPERPRKEVLRRGEHLLRGDLLDLERAGNRQFPRPSAPRGGDRLGADRPAKHDRAAAARPARRSEDRDPRPPRFGKKRNGAPGKSKGTRSGKPRRPR